MTTMNPLASLKEIGCIEWRINDANLDSRIRAACIRRNLDNLIDTTPRKFHGIILRCRKALDDGDYLELVSGLALLRSIIPVVYGMLTAGTAYHLPGEDAFWIKRKGGRVSVQSNVIYAHLPADMVVRPANA